MMIYFSRCDGLFIKNYPHRIVLAIYLFKQDGIKTKYNSQESDYCEKYLLTVINDIIWWREERDSSFYNTRYLFLSEW